MRHYVVLKINQFAYEGWDIAVSRVFESFLDAEEYAKKKNKSCPRYQEFTIYEEEDCE